MGGAKEKTEGIKRLIILFNHYPEKNQNLHI